MGKEEAIKLLQATRMMLLGKDNQPVSDLYDALDMAITALEQEPCEDEIEVLKKRSYLEGFHEANKLFHKEPCEDAISRQAVIDLATKGVLISNGNYDSVCKAINELPSVQPSRKECRTLDEFIEDMRERSEE